MFINLIKWLVRILFWLQAFAAAVIFFGLIAFLVYSKGEQYSPIAIGVFGIGVIAGIIIAEYIRRKIGLETFFGRIYGPNEMDEKKTKEE
jgi:hypothetical protein